MPELEDFVNEVLEENEEDSQTLKELQKILKSIKKEEIPIYRTYEIVSNT